MPYQRYHDLEIEVEDSNGFSKSKNYKLPVDQSFYDIFSQYRREFNKEATSGAYDTATLTDFGLSSIGGLLGFATGHDGKIYLVEQGSGFIIIDPTNDTATRTTFGISDATWTFRTLVLGPDRKLYAIPSTSQVIIIIDTDPESVDYQTATTTTYGLTLTDTNKWWGGNLAPNGKIYAVPNDSPTILIIDTLNQTATRSNLGATISGTNRYRGSVINQNGIIYGCPLNAQNVLRINTNNDTATNVTFGLNWSSGGSPLGTTGTFFSYPSLSPVLGSSIGAIFLAPQNSHVTLIIYPDETSATTNFSGTITTAGLKYTGSFVGGDGFIYFTPRESGHFLRIDPNNLTTATTVNFGLTIPTSGNYIATSACCLSNNGKTYLWSPTEAQFIILSCSTGNSTFDPKTTKSPFLNK
jgi:hypothetical protein